MEPTHSLVTGPPEPRGSAMPKSASGPHRVEIHASHTPPTSLGTLAVGVVTVAALYFGREVFVPMALAILLGFALAPFVLLLRRWHLGRVPSVVAVVVLAFLMIVGIGVFVGNQLAHLAGELPGYQTNIAQKIRSLRDTTTKGGVVDRTSAMLSNLK
jgi:predicted PurR-regulated permease PerM